MPIKDLPESVKVLPKSGQSMWKSTFNSVFESCQKDGGDVESCDAKAARIAWSAVKTAYTKKNEKWVKKKSMESSFYDFKSFVIRNKLPIPKEKMDDIYIISLLERKLELTNKL